MGREGLIFLRCEIDRLGIDMRKEFQEITPKSRSDFRRWLLKNHQQKNSVWVVIYKAESDKRNLSTTDVVDEVLCFGWIDSVPNKVDNEKFKLLVSPRKPQSGWSAVNKQRIAKLIKEGLMTSYGQAKIDLAKKNGAWAKLNSSDHFEMPKELNEGLKKNGKASLFWETVAPSSKRGILEWINSAKTEETRIKRIKETVRLAAIRIRANHYLDLKKIEKK